MLTENVPLHTCPVINLPPLIKSDSQNSNRTFQVLKENENSQFAGYSL